MTKLTFMFESPILTQLASPDADFRQEALDGLISDPNSVSVELRRPLATRLRELMLNEMISEPERQKAAIALGSLGCEEELRELVGSPSHITRGHVASGLGRCRTESSVLTLITQLTDEVNTVRNQAERSLISRLDDVKRCGVERLLELLGHPEPLTHSPAARLLGLTQDMRALPPLLTMLKSSEKWLSRVWAAKSLGDLGAAEGVPALIESLQEDEKNRVRAAAAAALGELRGSLALAPLKAALQDADEGVQSAARDALDRLSKSDTTQPEDPFAVGE